MRNLSRRDLIRTAGGVALAPSLTWSHPGSGQQSAGDTPFSWTLLQQRAAALAKRRYQPPRESAAAKALDFDAVGSIRFKPDRTLAGGIRLFPLGNGAVTPVTINLVENGRARPVVFSPELFEGGKVSPPPGFAGFRAMETGRESDWLAFLGASYFRSAGSQDQYGLSARGIAVDTGLAREQFPNFTEFWIEREGDQSYTIYALMDGESLTGAYRFISRHPKAVVQDVSSVLFLRRAVERLGVAPVTSMFWYDDRTRRGATDWRPEIHDSDGLALISREGERVWRPLRNPPQPATDSFAADHVRGFGLLQRDRNFDHYQDDGAFYDKRPNLWVEPRGDWGAGRVLLYAFPTDSETVDNVVAFWTPAAPTRAGQRLQFDYRLTWTSDDPSLDRAAHAADVWVGAAGRPGLPALAGASKLVADFVGDSLAGLSRDSGVSAEIGVVRGKLLSSAVYPVVGQRNRWRVTADVRPEAAGGNAGPVDVRLYLKRGEAALSETLLVPIYPA